MKAIKRGDETIGSEVQVKVVKNKCAPPFREAEFEILYGTGINKLGELVDTAEKLGLLEKSGTWYSYDGEKIGQGRDKVLAHLDEHPALQQQLRDALVAQARRAVAPAAGDQRSRVVTAPLLTPAQAAQLLDEVIYERLIELVDLDGLHLLEQKLALEIAELDEIDDDAYPDIAKSMIDRAWHRLAEDPRRYVRFGTGPFVDCELCEEERRVREKQ